MLKAAATLKTQLMILGATSEVVNAQAAGADAAIEDYRAKLERLPQPRQKGLRYLAIRMKALAGNADELVGSNVAGRVGPLKRYQRPAAAPTRALT